MSMEINGSRPRTADKSRVVTFDEAEELGAFELARQWADRLSWPALDRTASDELAELACMSALACWLARWQSIQIHRAVISGAEPAAVASALGARQQHSRNVPVLESMGDAAAPSSDRRPTRCHGPGLRNRGGHLRRGRELQILRRPGRILKLKTLTDTSQAPLLLLEW